MRPLNRRGAIRKPESSRLLDYRTVNSSFYFTALKKKHKTKYIETY